MKDVGLFYNTREALHLRTDVLNAQKPTLSLNTETPRAIRHGENLGTTSEVVPGLLVLHVEHVSAPSLLASLSAHMAHICTIFL